MSWPSLICSLTPLSVGSSNYIKKPNIQVKEKWKMNLRKQDNCQFSLLNEHSINHCTLKSHTNLIKNKLDVDVFLHPSARYSLLDAFHPASHPYNPHRFTHALLPLCCSPLSQALATKPHLRQQQTRVAEFVLI